MITHLESVQHSIGSAPRLLLFQNKKRPRRVSDVNIGYILCDRNISTACQQMCALLQISLNIDVRIDC